MAAAVRGGSAHAHVVVRDLAGRERGCGFLADDLGTLVTSHEAVDGLNRVVVHAPGERSFLAESADITAFPEWNLALVRTSGLGVPPLVIGAERARPAATAVTLGTGANAPRVSVTGTTAATYTSTECFHPLEDVLVLELPGAVAAPERLSRPASGTPVTDVATGAVLAVLGTALHAPAHGSAAVFAVPLRTAALLDPEGPMAELLRRNGATAPGFGPDLNLAGALRLTTASVAPAIDRSAANGAERRAPGRARGPSPGGVVSRIVERPEIAGEFLAFGRSGTSVLALVGDPGTGRSTELATVAARRTRGQVSAPSVWLRGADVRPEDGSVREAVGRALVVAGHRVRATGPSTGAATATAGAGLPEAGQPPARPEPFVGDPCEVNPDVVARLARDAGEPLLVLLDAPEEMPLRLAHGLRRWAAGTASWLRASGARFALACRPEYWEQAGPHFPDSVLHVPASAPHLAPGTGALPSCVRIGDLTPGQATEARVRFGLASTPLAPADAGHPLALRMLAELCTAAGGELPWPAGGAGAGGGYVPDRHDIFSAYFDLVGLRVAEYLAAPVPNTTAPGAGTDRGPAAEAIGRLREAARCCLRRGALDREEFERLFPWSGGWATAVLAEGVLVPAGDGYRFADEEFADWLQAPHLELDETLHALVPAGANAGANASAGPGTVPRHRIGPVVQALLLCGRQYGPEALSHRLRALVGALDPAAEPASPRGEAAWWAVHLLGETLLRTPDAGAYTGVLRALAGRITTGPGSGDFGPWFWRRLPLRAADRVDLLRRLLPADAPDAGPGPGGRFLDAASELLFADPATLQPLLCAWFDDERTLTGPAPGPRRPALTVADAAQALLHTHRRRSPDTLTEALLDAAHPRADELLAELAHDEPATVCRAVSRWAGDRRPERRAAAAVYGARAARHVRTEADRTLLRHAARALLLHRDDDARRAHATALALLVRDPDSRAEHLRPAITHFATTGARELADALGAALATHPEPVLTAFRRHLGEPGPTADEVLRVLARLRAPEPARQAAELVRAYAELRPERAGEPVAAFVRRRLHHGIAARPALRPLVTGLLRDGCVALRAPLGRALGSAAGALRDELLGELLTLERDPAVLSEVLTGLVRRRGSCVTGTAAAGTGATTSAAGTAGTAAGGGADGADAPGEEECAAVRRIGLLMGATPEGAVLFDRRLVELAGESPLFAARLHAWTHRAPDEWAALLGPGARHACEALRPV